jgi:DNA modification methylase
MGSFLRRHRVFLKDHIIWKKTLPWSRRQWNFYDENTIHTSYETLKNFEHIYLFHKEGGREIPSEDIVLKSKLTKEQWKAWVPSVWEINPVKKMEGHPSMFPDELVYRLIKMFSYEGDTVLDPFLGSGTTVKVARDLKRDAVGYERELQYKPVIMRKLGLLPEVASDESSETMAEHFEKTMPPERETSKPSVETVPSETEETLRSVEVGEEIPEDYLPA